MKTKIRIKNLSGKKIIVRFEPLGTYKNLSENDEIFIELEKINEGLVDLIIDENLDSIMWVENNDIFVNEIE